MMGKKAVLDKSVQALVPLMESLHAHLEIQTKELIKIRLLHEKKQISKQRIEKEIEAHQSIMQ